MKRVAYLGGYYPAEQSIRRSFTDHGVEIVFPYDILEPFGVYVGGFPLRKIGSRT